MTHLGPADRERLHRDHAAMLAAFTARDAEGLVAACAAHHGRLQSYIALLPRDTGLFAEAAKSAPV
jgi:DNA-binding GntR family transcriptional regulator